MAEETQNQQTVQNPAPQTGVPAQQTQEPVQNQPAPQASNPDSFPEFTVDNNGNIVIKDESAPPESKPAEGAPQTEPAQEGQSQTENPSDTNAQNVPNPQQKFKVKVDGKEEEHTFDEILNGFMRQADYTKKTTALAQQRRDLANILSGQQQNQQQDTLQQQRDAFTQMDAYAVNETKKIFGGEYDPTNGAHRAAHDSIIQRVNDKVMQLNRTNNNYSSFVATCQQDPHYNEINALALQKLNDLPYSKGAQIAQALRNKDVSVLAPYMKAVQSAYYSQKTNPQSPAQVPTQIDTNKVPFVESGGSQPPAPNVQQVKIDYNKLGHLKTSDQASIAEKLGLV